MARNLTERGNAFAGDGKEKVRSDGRRRLICRLDSNPMEGWGWKGKGTLLCKTVSLFFFLPSHSLYVLFDTHFSFDLPFFPFIIFSLRLGLVPKIINQMVWRRVGQREMKAMLLMHVCIGTKSHGQSTYPSFALAKKCAFILWTGRSSLSLYRIMIGYGIKREREKREEEEEIDIMQQGKWH